MITYSGNWDSLGKLSENRFRKPHNGISQAAKVGEATFKGLLESRFLAMLNITVASEFRGSELSWSPALPFHFFGRKGFIIFFWPVN